MIDDLIVRTEDQHPGFPSRSLGFLHLGESHDGQQVTGLTQSGGGAVENDVSFTGGTWYDVRLEAIPGGLVPAKNLFVGIHSHPFHQVDGDGQTALIIQMGIGHRGSV